MPLRIEIPDASLEYLSNGAKEELKESTLKYADGIIKEAGRLEAAYRTGNNDPEIIRQTIKDAVTYQKSPYNRSKTSKKAIIFQAVAALTTFISGNVLTLWAVNTSNTTLLWLFGATSIVAIITTILSFVGRDN
ncbi:hypothetical protein IQ781_04315 [Bacillus sp. N447-1]|uniref:hypothetical protein n=1 Tax=Bacillus TaxID=1386 RepID=UPI001F61F668|nr:hypothetical protein [Bacillus sp. N447-1]UNT69834.1 hypothetical protein IQ781_04315 [Bacillus sp. N447-1]